jgi:hypothetical protein
VGRFLVIAFVTVVIRLRRKTNYNRGKVVLVFMMILKEEEEKIN